MSEFVPGLEGTYGVGRGEMHNEPAARGLSEEHRLFWLEDVTPAELQEGFRHVRRHTTVPLAVGEVFNSVHDCRVLLTEMLIDYLRTTFADGYLHPGDEAGLGVTIDESLAATFPYERAYLSVSRLEGGDHQRNRGCGERGQKSPQATFASP